MDSELLKYPIYIVSKGRPDSCLTAKCFLKHNVPFLIAIEPQEYDQYIKYFNKENILVLPFSNLGLGSYPARNEVWKHSVKNNHEKHFIFDDNIYGFCRLNHGKRVRCNPIDALLSLQKFSDRYKKLAIAGFNYRYFVTRELKKPFFINTHVYSAMLITNNIPYRWRLKYNEDVGLCLQALHGGYNTILFNAFVVDKVSTTSKMKGGNQSELYMNNDPIKKAIKSCSLQQIWPQYVKVVYRFGRPHHQISWNKFFTHPLIKNSL